ncbi:5084_t:CDS:2, partial [Gigaspora margarita]
QDRMIASLLEKPFNYTIVNKLLENQNNTRQCSWRKWAQVYAPLERVQEKWFKALNKNISEKE